MAGTDPIDTHGHTVDDAEETYPGIGDEAPASTVDWQAGETVDAPMVLAQTAEEVQAQIDNYPG